MSTYKVDQEITTRYTNAPVAQEQQYGIGTIVDIWDTETNKMVAEFRVVSTDDTIIHGVITSVVSDD